MPDYQPFDVEQLYGFQSEGTLRRSGEAAPMNFLHTDRECTPFSQQRAWISRWLFSDVLGRHCNVDQRLLATYVRRLDFAIDRKHSPVIASQFGIEIELHHPHPQNQFCKQKESATESRILVLANNSLNRR
ncbi:hypothetical protein [Nitrosomonas sp. Nm34]|uniref:hypothetical protein n=1 Tax=Nitrosomonas sp. Nm34 TaxID=1881055 RepID=UPI0008EBEF8E|nr:hypothetical protein [Nitrosomonas sp. Nm34]SFI60145.1 hypothetical protein SAMN05428978_101947 [Nitrosomonas sp. Nm34]